MKMKLLTDINNSTIGAWIQHNTTRGGKEKVLFDVQIKLHHQYQMQAKVVRITKTYSS